MGDTKSPDVKSTQHACRICGTKPAIDAHLIPQCFVAEILIEPKSNEKHFLHNNSKNFKQPSNTGRYAKDLLCANCDGNLGVFENSALMLLKRLRTVKVGKNVADRFYIREGAYRFQVAAKDEFIRFSCGIMWKYASLPLSDASHIRIGPHRDICEQIAFRGGVIPKELDVFIERDLFSIAAFADPEDVYYYCTPSVGALGDVYTVPMSWFSVGGFIVYVKLSDEPTDFVHTKLWMKGKKSVLFNVDVRALETNRSIMFTIDAISGDLSRINKRLNLVRTLK